MKNSSKATSIKKASEQFEQDYELLEKDFDYCSQAYSRVLGYGRVSEDELQAIIGGKVNKKDIIF